MIHGLLYHGRKMVYLLIHRVHDIGWEKNRENIFDYILFYRIGPAGFQLLINQADPSQSGIYTCLAYSKAGEAKQQFRLTVLGNEIKNFPGKEKNEIFFAFSSSTNSKRKYIISRRSSKTYWTSLPYNTRTSGAGC